MRRRVRFQRQEDEYHCREGTINKVCKEAGARERKYILSRTSLLLKETTSRSCNVYNSKEDEYVRELLVGREEKSRKQVCKTALNTGLVPNSRIFTFEGALNESTVCRIVSIVSCIPRILVVLFI